jgi:hypothetical protein
LRAQRDAQPPLRHGESAVLGCVGCELVQQQRRGRQGVARERRVAPGDGEAGIPVARVRREDGSSSATNVVALAPAASSESSGIVSACARARARRRSDRSAARASPPFVARALSPTSAAVRLTRF